MKCGVLRTFGSMQTRHLQFRQSGGQLVNASKHANCLQPSLIEEDPSEQVLDIFPPAQLHLMLGGVNALENVLESMFTSEKIVTWLTANGIIKHGYNGGGLDGNNCKRLLDKVDALEQVLPPTAAPVIDCFRAFKHVVEGVGFMFVN